MNPMPHPGWVLLIIGIAMAVVGLVWLLVPSIPFLGRLPGDIAVERDNFRFYFPLTSCILLSAVVTALVWLVRYLAR